MKKKATLSRSMKEEEFDNGYWYALDLKEFAVQLGVPSASQLRKDELEKAIKTFLRTGKIVRPTRRSLSRTGIRDVDIGLSLDLPVVNYTSNKETKDFLVREANKLVADLKRKSGSRYRLNRWREAQLGKGIRITYRDLVNEYVKLNQTKERFAQVPTGRYINFLSDFLAVEKATTREQAIRAWKELKAMNVPKNYQAWKKCQRHGSS